VHGLYRTMGKFTDHGKKIKEQVKVPEEQLEV